MRDDIYSLYLKVVLGRRRLEKLVNCFGLGDQRVVKYSQQLDKDIVELQRRMVTG